VPEDASTPSLDEWVARDLHRIFDDVVEAQRLVDDAKAPHFEIHPRSALAADDARSSPYQVSHEVVAQIGVAVDHLHALETLIRGAQALHLGAPFSLVRPALEASATAAWILSPRSRSERIKRRLTLAAKDARDNSRAEDELAAQVPVPLESRLNQIKSILVTATSSDAIPKFATTDVMKAAAAATGDQFHPVLAWMCCSGFAHGRSWASRNLLDREVFETDNPEVKHVRLTSDVTRVWWATRASHILLTAATVRYKELSANHLGG
jgi:hypothetical protein